MIVKPLGARRGVADELDWNEAELRTQIWTQQRRQKHDVSWRRMWDADGTMRQGWSPFPKEEELKFKHFDDGRHCMPIPKREQVTHGYRDESGSYYRPSPIMSADGTLYRVPVERYDEKTWCVHIGSHLGIFYGMYYPDFDLMPSHVRFNLMMVFAEQGKHVINGNFSGADRAWSLDASGFPEEFREIGWRVDEKFYSVIMPEHELKAIRGDVVDPRE